MRNISALFLINMQTSDCLAIILPECTELNQTKLLVQKQQETKPLQTPGPSKNKGDLLFILKWHWRTVGPRSRITCFQTSQWPAASSSLNLGSKQILKPYRCWGRQKGEWVGFKHANRYWEQVKGCRSLQPDSQRQGSKLTAWTKLREIGQERLGCRLSMKPLAVLILLLYGRQT